MTRTHFNYVSANRAGYKFEIYNIHNHMYDKLAYWDKTNFPDIKITRPGITTNLSLLNTNALLSVNGYFHKTITKGSELFIPLVTRSMLKSRANQLGIFSFNNLDTPINVVSITPDMITPDGSYSLLDKAIITFSNEINVAFLCIAGYLIFEEPGVLYKISPNSYALHLSKLNYIEKLYELNEYRDIFDELYIPLSTNNPSLIDGTVARADSTIVKFLTLNNSFLVQIPVSNLQTRKVFLERTNIPSTFRTEIKPQHLLFGGYGKTLEYITREIDGTKYQVNTLDAYYNNYLFSKLPQEDIKLFNDHRMPNNTLRLVQAYFLEIFTENTP